MLVSADPFDSLESAQEYVRLLVSQLEVERTCLEEALAEATQTGAARRLTALQIVDYKLTQLSGRLTDAARILNDLRMLRRVLLGQPEAITTTTMVDIQVTPGSPFLAT